MKLGFVMVCLISGMAHAQGLEQFYTKGGPVGTPQDACVPSNFRQEPESSQKPEVSEGYVKAKPVPVQERKVVLTVKNDGSVVDCVFLGQEADYYPQGWVLYQEDWYQIRTDPCTGSEAAYSFSSPSAAPIRVVRQRSN